MTTAGMVFFVAAVALTGASLTGCGSSQASSPTTATTSTSSPSSGTINRGTPTISGVPATTAVVGKAYSFQPQVTNTSGATVHFTVAHAPAWAKFDTATGQLSGTPATSQVGQYAGIAISLVAGTTPVALPAFTITVSADASSSAPAAITLSWDAPTENADGSPLIDLKGYKLHYGSASRTYADTIQVSNPGLTTYVVQNLPAGKYYFAITAYNSTGQESALSPEVATQVN